MEGSAQFYSVREVGKLRHALAEKKLTLWLRNSNMVKPEKFYHLHLAYHFTVPLEDKMVLRMKNCNILEVLWKSLLLGRGGGHEKPI